MGLRVLFGMAEADTATGKTLLRSPYRRSHVRIHGSLLLKFYASCKSSFLIYTQSEILWRAFKGIALFSWEHLRKEKAPAQCRRSYFYGAG
jgi:hypothetical protein